MVYDEELPGYLSRAAVGYVMGGNRRFYLNTALLRHIPGGPSAGRVLLNDPVYLSVSSSIEVEALCEECFDELWTDSVA